jgi:hypothetical protein
MKTHILSLLLLPLFAFSMENFSPPGVMKGFEGCGEIIIPPSRVSSPSKLGNIAAIVNRNGFSVIKEGQETRILDHDVDPILRKANQKQLLRLLKDHRLRITQYDNGDYKATITNSLKGGGPLTAGLFYGATKVICYGGAAIGIGCAANAALSRFSTEKYPAIAKVSGAAIAGGAAIATGGLSQNASVVVTAIEGGISTDSRLQENIAGATVAIGTTAGVGFFGLVESAACWAFALGMALPTP